MRMLKAVALCASVLCVPASTASAQVQLALADGRVTLVARDATVRQILTEWARVGQTKIVNVERIPGGPVTLQFTGLPEEEALDILLRSMSGYMAVPRPAAVANLSRYDRILVMPTVAPPRVVSATPGPVFQQPAIIQAAPDDQDQSQPAPTVVAPARGPIFQTFPQPQVANPAAQAGQAPATGGEQAPPAASTPGASTQIGAPRPGMVVQPPTPPGLISAGQPEPAR